MLRVLSIAGALALTTLTGITVAQDASAAGNATSDTTSAVPDSETATTAPADGPSAADNPLGASRSAIAQAKALFGSKGFQAGIDRQRAGLSTAADQHATHPQFQVNTPQALGSAAMADALSPPVRQWAMDNRQPMLILVSFSMPDSELLELARQGAHLGAPLVLRGLVDDSFPATQKRLMPFRQIKGASFRIDPTVFQRFGVDQVPTFILPLEALQTCSTQRCQAPAHVRLTGDAGLDYVLDEIDRRSADPRTHALVQPMRAQLTADEAP